ncbi:MAG: diphthine synthase [Candidatus Bathyarchaeia archaeon]
MGELVFVGLGLYDERDISLRGLETIREANHVFVELYTSLMAGFSVERLEKLAGKRVSVVSRRVLEEENGKPILQKAKEGKTVLLVPGDPLIATTHIDLRIRAEKLGIKTHLVHGASIISAVVGLTGLQNYKFGRSITIPFTDNGKASLTPYYVVMENKSRGLHTLVFLDIKAEEKRYMTVKEGLETLLGVEALEKKGVINSKTLAVGVSRAGSENPVVKADYIKKLVDYDFGFPPHTLIFPGKLHFMEAEALITLAGAPQDVREMAK